MTTINPSQSTGSYESIKLGIDAHAKYYWVSRQIDGATPQPVQKMTYEELMLFVVKPELRNRTLGKAQVAKTSGTSNGDSPNFGEVGISHANIRSSR